MCYPHLLIYVNFPQPDKRYDVDGLSLSPLLTGKANSWKRNHLFLQYHGGAHHKFALGPLTNSVVMTERWRLVNTDKAEELYDIVNDPAQRNNFAIQRPGIVKNLRTAYQSFWQRVSPGLKPVAIDLGDPSENPAVLCSQDWRPETGNPPWNFSSIKKIPKVTHPWLVNVLKAGEYRFTLRQWPKEAINQLLASRLGLK
jgi:uncharacterized sulfatase